MRIFDVVNSLFAGEVTEVQVDEEKTSRNGAIPGLQQKHGPTTTSNIKIDNRIPRHLPSNLENLRCTLAFLLISVCLCVVCIFSWHFCSSSKEAST